MKAVLRGLVTAMFAITIMALGVFASSQTFAASSRAATNQSFDDKIWQINANAHLLKMDNTAVWVHIQSPDNIKKRSVQEILYRPFLMIIRTP